MVETIAKRRPDWSFVFVGPVREGLNKPNLTNVHFIGYVPYEVLPGYLAAFDVCILPFRRDRVTESVNPIKMYEYMATGKPIVSTSIPEVERYSDLIRIAEGPEAFEKAISDALKEDTPQLAKARRAMARENSWERRVWSIREIVRMRREDMGI